MLLRYLDAVHIGTDLPAYSDTLGMREKCHGKQVSH